MIVRTFVIKKDGTREDVGSYLFTVEKIDKMNKPWEENKNGEPKKDTESCMPLRISILCCLKRLNRIYRSLKIW